MIGKVLNKEIATCFWVGRDNDGELHIFNEEPYLSDEGGNFVWKAVDGSPFWILADSDIFSCVQLCCLYKVTMNFKLKNYEDAKCIYF